MQKDKKVLIITSSIDCTVDYIMRKYSEEAKFHRLNVDEFSKYKISVGGKNQWCIVCDEWQIEKRDIHSIYYRKPRLPSLDEFAYEYQGMIAKDIIAVINGIVDEFEGRVLTKPYLLRKTENKIFQLLYAEKNGFLIPESFIGNSEEARKFTGKKSIIKPITTGKVITKNGTEIYQTNYFTELSEEISLTPIYLQKYERKQYEVRLESTKSYLLIVKEKRWIFLGI